MELNQVRDEAFNTSQRMLMEYLWEAVLNFDPDPERAVERVATVMLQQANDAPHSNEALAIANGDHLEMVRLHTIQELESFWDHLRMKIRMRSRR